MDCHPFGGWPVSTTPCNVFLVSKSSNPKEPPMIALLIPAGDDIEMITVASAAEAAEWVALFPGTLALPVV